jgi:hypothetical protein
LVQSPGQGREEGDQRELREREEGGGAYRSIQLLLFMKLNKFRK